MTAKIVNSTVTAGNSPALTGLASNRAFLVVVYAPRKSSQRLAKAAKRDKDATRLRFVRRPLTCVVTPRRVFENDEANPSARVVESSSDCSSHESRDIGWLKNASLLTVDPYSSNTHPELVRPHASSPSSRPFCTAHTTISCLDSTPNLFCTR